MRLVGSAVSGLPVPGLPALSATTWPRCCSRRVGVAIVGYSDNVLTARAFAARRGETIDGDDRALALGAANVAAGLLRGFPVSSSGSRTAIGDAQGSRTQLHSLVALASCSSVLVAGRALLSRFPRAALGAVVIYAALRLIDVAGFRRIARFRRSEAAARLVTTVAVLPRRALRRAGRGRALGARPAAPRSPARTTACSATCPASPGCTTSTTTPTPSRCPAWSSTATTPRCASPTPRTSAGARSPPLDADAGPPRWFLLNAEANVEIDITAAETLEALHAELRRRGIVLALARVKQDLRARPAGRRAARPRSARTGSS